MCSRGASPETPRSKFAVVGLQDRLAHHTLQLRVYVYKVCHGTEHNWRCLEDNGRNCKYLALLPGIVPILHDSLLNYMTIITKVGVSYIDHMNDDAPEVDSFLHTLSGSLLPPVFEESLEQGYPSPNISNN